MKTAAFLALAALLAFAHAHADDGPVCRTPELSEQFKDDVERVMANFKSKVCPKVASGVLRMCDKEKKQVQETSIPVIWNIFYDPETGAGNVSDETIVKQIEIMNVDYQGRNGLGYNMQWRFHTLAINRIANARWFSNMIALEQQFKPQLANGTENNLHIYTGEMGGGVLGMCYFSFMYPPKDPMHGCLVNHVSLVGGGLPPYDGGQTAVHEVGHHLGLYHVWQAGCSDRSDRVEDTPPQETNSRGCPDPIPQSCTPGLFDNIHNHMDYSDDACRYLFTKGQSDRTDEVISTFHPGYLGEAVRQAVLEAVPDAWDEAISFQQRAGEHFKRSQFAY